MVMALSLFHRFGKLVIIAAYENGLVIVAELHNEDTWVVTYGAKAHSQPILSLDTSPDKDYFFTSSADASIVKHPIPRVLEDEQQPTEAPLSSPDTAASPKPSLDKSVQGGSLLSAALATQPRQPQTRTKTPVQVQTEPLKVVNTKHSGQQGLKIRSDARIFATAGWDSKIRVYSAKTIKEVAVLKWHQVGCYAVAFSSLEEDDGGDRGNPASGPKDDQGGDTATETVGAIVPKLVDVSVRDRRIRYTKTAHWLAAGSKDGKVSLWDVF